MLLGSNSNFLLVIDGVQCGFLKSFRGGDTFAEVVEEREEMRDTYYSKKHLGRIVNEGFDIEIDMSMKNKNSLYYWITAFWNGNLRRRSGRVIIFNDDMSDVKEFEFFHAIMTATSIPLAEIQSSEPKTITVKLIPEYSLFKTGLNSIKIEELR